MVCSSIGIEAVISRVDVDTFTESGWSASACDGPQMLTVLSSEAIISGEICTDCQRKHSNHVDPSNPRISLSMIPLQTSFVETLRLATRTLKDLGRIAGKESRD